MRVIKVNQENRETILEDASQLDARNNRHLSDAYDYMVPGRKSTFEGILDSAIEHGDCYFGHKYPAEDGGRSESFSFLSLEQLRKDYMFEMAQDPKEWFQATRYLTKM